MPKKKKPSLSKPSVDLDLGNEIFSCSCKTQDRRNALYGIYVDMLNKIDDLEADQERLEVSHKLLRSLNEHYRNRVADLEDDIQNLKERP